jgi:hypothetical protein
VDRGKTFGWSTCPAMRRRLRDCNIPVLHHARELGGHLGVSRQYTNKTLTQRITELDDFWPKLRHSRARYHAKVYMLRAVAWPRGLHAVSSAPVGDQIWLDLRRKAVKALSMQKPGVNPAVLLGLVEPMLDPQFLAVLWTFRSVRSHCPLDFWADSIAPLAHGDLDLPPHAPASVALGRAQSVGLSVLRSGLVRDQFGLFCPQTCNAAEMDLRLQVAWVSVVAHKVSHRADFAGLEQVDFAATRRALVSLAYDEQSLYRLSLAGGLFTESYKSKWADRTDRCRWCGAVDTLQHRYWECPQHHDLRTSLAPDVAPILNSIPPALSLRGWALLPPTWNSWICLLAALPAALPSPSCVFTCGVWSDLFTDGSCRDQSNPLCRFAAWSVTVASACRPTWCPGLARVMAAS